MYEIHRDTDELKQYFEIFLGGNNDLLGGIFTAVKNTNSCIAGGSLLSYINKDKVNDLDIYVPSNEYINFLKYIIGPGGTIVQLRKMYILNQNLSSKYDDSFFKKNKIRLRYSFKIKGKNNSKLKVDIMIIDTDYLKVVTNFDLTFCEIFYDGTSIYTTSKQNFENIKLKKGILKPDYHKSFRDNNKFIHNRLKKYMEKGYNININSTTIQWDDLVSYTDKNEIKKKKRIDNEEEFVVKCLIEILLDYNTHSELYINLFEKIDVTPHTYLELRRPIYKEYILILFVSLLEDFTLNSFKKLFSELIDQGFEPYYINLLGKLERRMEQDVYKSILRYKDWYFYGFTMRKLATAISINKQVPLSDVERIRTILFPVLHRAFPYLLNRRMGECPSWVEVKRKMVDLNLTDKEYEEAHKVTIEYYKKHSKCLLLNPKMIDPASLDRKDQLECFLSSEQNTSSEIIKELIMLPFKYVVKNDYYVNRDKEIVLIPHSLERPIDFNGPIIHDPNAMSFDIVEGEEVSVETALKSKKFVFKFKENYFHFDEKSLNQTLLNKDSWMYECKSTGFDYEELFVKLNGNGSFLIPCKYLYHMFDSNRRLFEIVETNTKLNKTASFKNTDYGITMDIADYVSANHCQSGSDFKVYILKNDESYENTELKPLFNNGNSDRGGYKRKSVKNKRQKRKSVKNKRQKRKIKNSITRKRGINLTK